MVTEIAKGDEDHISTSLRTAIEVSPFASTNHCLRLCDCSCLAQRGWLQSFPDILHEAKKKKDSEIDRICSRHYSDFLNSVNEMLNMQDSVKALKESVRETHQKFSSTGGDLVSVLESLNRIQLERDHTRKALEAALLCKDIASLMVEARKQIENDEHYTAMRTIEIIQAELSNAHLQPMLKCLETWLPVTINKLLYGARCEADAFMHQLRMTIPLLGSTILVRQAKQSSNLDNMRYSTSHSSSVNAAAGPYRRFSTLSPSKGDSDWAPPVDQLTITLKYILSNPSAFHLDTQLKPLQFDNFISLHFKQSLSSEGLEVLDHKLSDMAALHKVYHLYAILGQVRNYLDHYETLRTAHFQQILKQFEYEINHSQNQVGLAGCIPRYFEQIVGFFTIECVVARIIESNSNHRSVHDGSSIFSHAEYVRLWTEAMQHLETVLQSLAITITSPDDMIQIKEELVLLLHVMTDDMFNFDCTNLVSVIVNLFEIFEALEVQLLTRNTISALEKCAYQSFLVKDYESFVAQIRPYQLDRIEINHESYMMPTGAEGLQDAQLIERKGQQQRILRQVLDANLDALEEEIGLHAPLSAAPSTPTRSFGESTVASPPQNVNPSSGSNFMAQTYPFSEFVPLVCKELHAALLRTVLYLFIKPPEALVMMLNNSNISSFHIASNSGSKQKFFSDAVAAHMNEQRLKACEALVLTLSRTNFIDFIAQSMSRYYEVIANLLTKELRKDGLETALSKACQISIDSAALALSCEYLWGILEQSLQHCYGIHSLASNASASSNPVPAAKPSKLARHSKSAVPVPVSSPTSGAKFYQIYEEIISMLRDVTSQAQDMIFELLSNKIDGLLESLVFIDYEPTTLAGGSNNNAHQSINLTGMNSQYVHECVESIVEFLEVTFMMLTHLPQTIRESIHFISCSKVSTCMLNYLLDKAPRVNIFGLISLDADVKKLSQFADTCGTPHLRSCFEELSQLVRFLLHPDLPQLIENSALRKQHFPSTNPHKIASILDKVGLPLLFATVC